MSKQNKAHVAIAFVLCSFPMWGATISVVQTPASPLVPGQVFSATVNATGIADLYAYEFNLEFDPAVLAAVSVTEGPFLNSAGTTLFIPGTIDNTTGTVGHSSGTLVGQIPGTTGTGVLETVQFRALANGSSPLNLTGVILLDSKLGEISAETVNSVAGAPEPGTWVGLAFGMGWLISRRLWSRAGSVPR